MTRNIFTGITVFLAFVFGYIALPLAQVQTYSYTGPSYNYSECIAAGGTEDQCIASGSLFGSLTLVDLPTAWTGAIYLPDYVSNFVLSASGVGSVNVPDKH